MSTPPENKGFAGFSSLSSEPAAIKADVSEESKTTTPQAPSMAVEENNSGADSNKEPIFTNRAWWLVIVGLLIWAATSDSNKEKPHPAPTATTANNDYTPPPMPQQQVQQQAPPSINFEPAQPQLETSPPPAASLPLETAQASFDCSSAMAPLEVIICSNKELSSLDGSVGKIYNSILVSLSDDGDQKRTFLESQRNFLKNRLKVCPIPVKAQILDEEAQAISTCLKEQYTLRLRDLEKQNEDNKIKLALEITVTAAVTDLYKQMNITGVAGLPSEIDGCYLQASPNTKRNLIYCLTFDIAAHALTEAVEKNNNLPRTSYFEDIAFLPRARDNILKIGITAPDEQTRFIKAIENDAMPIFVKLLKSNQKAGQ